MQDDMLRHHLFMHASNLEEVQDIASAIEAAGSVAPMQVGAVKSMGKKGKDVNGRGKRRTHAS